MPASSENLTPEQRKAIKVVQDCLPYWNQFLCADYTVPEICITDSKVFTTQKISYSDLYHGKDWIWNQSNAKKKVTFENDVYAVVQKFNTRKKKKNTPSDGLIFKLWMFYVYKQTDNTFLGVFIWCEKGYPPNHFQKPQFNNNNYWNPSWNDAPQPKSNIFSFPLLVSGGNQPQSNYSFPVVTQNVVVQNKTASYEPLPVEEDPLLKSVQTILNLDDLDFLKVFVDEQTAHSLGW